MVRSGASTSPRTRELSGGGRQKQQNLRKGGKSRKGRIKTQRLVTGARQPPCIQLWHSSASSAAVVVLRRPAFKSVAVGVARPIPPLPLRAPAAPPRFPRRRTPASSRTRDAAAPAPARAASRPRARRGARSWRDDDDGRGRQFDTPRYVQSFVGCGVQGDCGSPVEYEFHRCPLSVIRHWCPRSVGAGSLDARSTHRARAGGGG